MATGRDNARFELWALGQNDDNGVSTEDLIRGLAVECIDELIGNLVARAGEGSRSIAYHSQFIIGDLPSDIAKSSIQRLSGALADEKHLGSELRTLWEIKRDIEGGVADPEIVNYYSQMRLDQLEAAAQENSEQR